MSFHSHLHLLFHLLKLLQSSLHNIQIQRTPKTQPIIHLTTASVHLHLLLSSLTLALASEAAATPTPTALDAAALPITPIAHCAWCPTTTSIQPQVIVIVPVTSTYCPPIVTVPAVVVVTATQPQGAVADNQGYCSTLYEQGPGLPTARQGSCGTILILEARAGRARGAGWWEGLAVVVAGLVVRLMLWG